LYRSLGMMARLFQDHGAEVLFSTGLGGLTMICNHQRDLKCFPRCALPPSHPSKILGLWCVGTDRRQPCAFSVT
jgi:hypothetical protein